MRLAHGRAFRPEDRSAPKARMGVDWISKAICRIGKAAGDVVEREVQGLRESFEHRADWHRLLEQHIDQERVTLAEAVVEIEGDPWEHLEAKALPVEVELLMLLQGIAIEPFEAATRCGRWIPPLR